MSFPKDVIWPQGSPLPNLRGLSMSMHIFILLLSSKALERSKSLYISSMGIADSTAISIPASSAILEASLRWAAEFFSCSSFFGSAVITTVLIFIFSQASNPFVKLSMACRPQDESGG